MASLPWSLVSPASRGIGFALTRQLLQTTKAPVVTTARKDLDAVRENMLKGLDGVDEGRLKVLKVDVLDETSIADAASECKSLFPASDKQGEKSYHLRLAFLIPGILHPEKALAQVDADAALQTFRVNTIGPLLLLKHFADFLPTKQTDLTTSSEHSDANATGLPSRAVAALMSARVGSITDNNGLGGWYSYRASKAAVSQLARTTDQQLRRVSANKAFSLALHPGTTKTDLSRDYWETATKTQLLEPEESATKLMKVLMRAAEDKGKKEGLNRGEAGAEEGFWGVRGRCLDYDGKIVPP